MVNATDCGRDQINGQGYEARLSNSNGNNQCITLASSYAFEVAMSTLSTDNGNAKMAMPVRIVESAVRFSERSN